jgi:hypothetical protein
MGIIWRINLTAWVNYIFYPKMIDLINVGKTDLDILDEDE